MRKKRSLVPCEPTWNDLGGRLDSVVVFRLRLVRAAFWNILRFPFLIIGWVLSVLWRAVN